MAEASRRVSTSTGGHEAKDRSWRGRSGYFQAVAAVLPRVRVLTPPEIVSVGVPVVFLAGPIQNGPDWQAKAAELLTSLDPELVVASPRADYSGKEFVYERQVDWETHYLRRAGARGVVVFWLAHHESVDPERPYAQTTRFEIGEWKAFCQLLGADVVVGFDEGFSNSRYIRRRFSQDCPNAVLCSSLEETCAAAVALIAAQRKPWRGLRRRLRRLQVAFSRTPF